MKTNRTLIFLLMGFVVLAVIVALQNAQQNAILATPIPLTNAVFQTFGTDDIQAVRLRSPESGESFSISRAADGTWTSESSGTLDQTEANNIARTMVAMMFSDSFTVPEGDNLMTYGFTPEGVLSVEIVLANGESHAVAVGYRTPTEENYYAVVDDRAGLYLIDRPAVDYLISRLKSPPIA